MRVSMQVSDVLVVGTFQGKPAVDRVLFSEIPPGSNTFAYKARISIVISEVVVVTPAGNISTPLVATRHLEPGDTLEITFPLLRFHP